MLRKFLQFYLVLQCYRKFLVGEALADVHNWLAAKLENSVDRSTVLQMCGVPYEEAKKIAQMNDKLEQKLKENGTLEELLRFNPLRHPKGGT